MNDRLTSSWRALALACSIGCISAGFAQSLGPVLTTTLADFEDGGVAGFAKVTPSNSAATVDSQCAVANTTDAGSKRLLLTDSVAGTNGCVATLTASIPGPGNWLITADVKVENVVTGGTNMIDSFGMAVKLGATSTAKVPDGNAGYVMDLPDDPAGAAAKGYRTIGARIEAPTSLSYPQDLTIYFSTDPSRDNDASINANDGNFNGGHRTAASSWQSTSNRVFIDNIKRIGPGRLSEDRHLWISIGDGYHNNQTQLNTYLTQAKANNYTAIDVLARYRANRFYRKNRDYSTYANPEPAYISGIDTTFDPIQYCVDRGKELGLKVYVSFSCFLVTDGVGTTYPAILPPGSITWVYNSGSPRAQISTDNTEGYWTDPGRADVRNYTRSVLMDLVQNYDIDGVIFDRIRYAGTSYGYNPTALSEMGISGTPATSNAAFSNERREAVATFLQDCYTSVTALKPWVVVGTVPIAYGNSLSDTYNTVFQGWYRWNTLGGGNRTISFGSQDLSQPQFYRQWDSGSPYTAPAANEALMGYALYGDTSSFSRDYGQAPGALTNVAPLLYWESFTDATDADNTAATIAQNVCDSRNVEGLGLSLQGWGTYAADEAINTKFTSTGTARLRAATVSCGTDVMGSASEGSDFLMKAGYDRTPPTTVTGLTVTGGLGSANLSWSAPATAADGETAHHYLIYRSSTSGIKQYRANQVTTSVVTATSFVDNTVPVGSWYYRVVPVDDYNNWGPAAEFGPVSVTGADLVVESRQSGGALTAAPAYQESTAFSDTSAKSTVTNPGVTGTGSRYLASGSAVGTSVTLRPNVAIGGYYNVYVTLASSSGGASPGPSNNAVANYTITNYGPDQTGSVTLAPATSGLPNQWLLLKSQVPFAPGQSKGITFVCTSASNRFCIDAVRFEFDSYGPAPVPVVLKSIELD